MIPFQVEQMQMVRAVVSLRGEFLDGIFRVLAYGDSPYFVFILVASVWVGFSYRWGLRLFYLLVIDSLVNMLCKELFGWSRPCVDMPGIGMICPKSFGFPSGGAQMAMLLGGLLIYSWRTRAAWWVGIGYILVLSFSRIYLGAHYPLDILGGWVIGLGLLFLYMKTIGPLERFLGTKSLLYCLVLSVGIPVLLMLVAPSWRYVRFDAVAVGLGAFLSLKYGLYLPAPKGLWEGLWRALVGTMGALLIFWCLPKCVFVPWKFGILALWVSLCASPFCRRIQKCLSIR